MSPPKKKPLAAIHLTILKLLREHPEGLDIEQIRALGKIEGQQHLDKRVRELYPFFPPFLENPVRTDLALDLPKFRGRGYFLTQ